MACTHKFHQYLNLNNLDFEPTTLIVGTFNRVGITLTIVPIGFMVERMTNMAIKTITFGMYYLDFIMSHHS